MTNEAKSKSSREMIRNLTEYVVAINRNYQMIMANDLFIDRFGMQPNDLCYRVWKKRNEVCENCLVAQSFQDGQEHWNVEDVVLKDGQIVEMLVKSTPVKNEEGHIIYVLETAIDISQRNLFQNAAPDAVALLEDAVANRLASLKLSEERYRTLFERSRDAMMLIDLSSRIIEVNAIGVAMFGRPDKEALFALPSAVSLFQNPDEYQQFKELIYREGYVTEFETRCLSHPDRTFDALITGNALVDTGGSYIGLALIIRDITTRKQAHRSIERQNKRLSALNAIAQTVNESLNLQEILEKTLYKISEVLDADCVSIYLLDERQEILNLAAQKGLSPQNLGRREICSFPAGEGLRGRTVLTRKTAAVQHIHHRDDPYTAAMTTQGLSFSLHIPLAVKGKPLGVMCVSSSRPMSVSREYVEFMTAIGHQIGMAVDNAGLYQNAKKAYEELKEAQEQIVRSEKLASLGKLAATIAHEINNPLAAVLTYSRLMLKQLAKGCFAVERQADIQRYLETIEAETSRCGEIVKNLLAFSRQSQVVFKPRSISEIIERTRMLLAHELEMHNILLVEQLADDLPRVLCDFKQIQQALLNILCNCAEAMENGGTLTIETRMADTDPESVEIVISDTGPGIDTENLDHIFEPFFTTKAEGKGVGLGLSVVYGIIKRHHGDIQISTEKDAGSTFRVRLPVALEEN